MTESYLPDANVWFALNNDVHVNHRVVKAWVDQRGKSSSLAFCRITQLALLRLLSNRVAMEGAPCTQAECWRIFHTTGSDARVMFRDEPAEFLTHFRRVSSSNSVAPNRWSDDYLLAFAASGNLQLVTLDRALAARSGNAILLTA